MNSLRGSTTDSYTMDLAAAGWITVYSAIGWVRYAISRAMQSPVALSLAINQQQQQYRLCINLGCPWPSQVSGRRLKHLTKSQAALERPDRYNSSCSWTPFHAVLQAWGVQVAASGWVSSPASSLGAITLGSPTGKSMAGTVQGLWVLPGAVAFDSLAAEGQTLADVLAGITAPAAAAPPVVSLQVQTAAPVVGAPVSVVVSASAANVGSSVRVRVTFYGAAPR